MEIITSLKPLRLKEIDAIYFLTKSALYLFFIADACNKFLFLLHYPFYRTSIFFRSLYELLFLIVILLFINEVRLLFLKIFFILFALFICGQVLISFQVDYAYNYLENISNFNKYFFVFIIYFSIYKLTDYTEKFQKIIKLMEGIFLLNSIVTILGVIFQITLLRTYTDSDRIYRYGYSGFIPAQNEATLFFFLSVSYFYYKHFILNLKSRRFLIVLLSSLVLGTKGIYLFLFLLLIFHFLYFSNLKAKIISLFLMIGIFISGYLYLQTRHSQILLEYFISRKDKLGWFSMLVSSRDSFIITKGVTITGNWNIINYFIGGQDQTKLAIEMDFIDLFFFLGIIGSVVFFMLYLSTLFKFNILKPFYFFFVLTFFFLAFFGGHFFASAVNALYVCLISMYFHHSQKNIFEYS